MIETCHPLNLHSFPTRRSSDLAAVEDIHHGAREEIRGRIRGVARKIFIKRLLEGNGGSTRGSHGNGKDGIGAEAGLRDRKSTRLNSSHRCISYAVFCLKKKIKA